MFFAMGRATLSFGREGAVDIHRVGKTMVTWLHGRMVAFTDSQPSCSRAMGSLNIAKLPLLRKQEERQ
jgi:hypothetical protein